LAGADIARAQSKALTTESAMLSYLNGGYGVKTNDGTEKTSKEWTMLQAKLTHVENLEAGRKEHTTGVVYSTSSYTGASSTKIWKADPTALFADKTARADYLAADLMSQAEHDVLASAILLTDDASLADKVNDELKKQRATLSRKEIIEKSLRDYGVIIVCRNIN
jgi:hypothetical protein